MQTDTIRQFHILNLGAGVQSTALYLMFMRGEIKPQIDYAIFADTQDEPRAVYEHLEWLKSLNGPPILVRTKGRLGDDLINGTRAGGAGKNRFATIPAFVADGGTGSPGIQKRQCSKDYKIAKFDTRPDPRKAQLSINFSAECLGVCGV